MGACSWLTASPSPANEALRRGAEWLWRQQVAVGGFPSTTVGLFAPGHSLTGLALLALTGLDPAIVPARRDAAARGLAFLAGARHPEAGGLGLTSKAPDYPVYATAMALSLLCRLKPEGFRAIAQPLADYLLSQQLAGDAWAEHPAHGGFPMGSVSPPVPPRPGHVDLSMTRHAAEALAAWGAPAEALTAARAYVLRSRADDGGFVYAVATPEANKGQTASASYGTATADGLLALLATGGEPADVVDAAHARLVAIHEVGRNPGVAGGRWSNHAAAMRGYYRALAAKVFARLGGPDGWAPALIDAVVAEQRQDGSWVNERAEQKENDPLVATSLALLALTSALGAD